MNPSLDCNQDDVVPGSTHTEGNFICNSPSKMISARNLCLWNCEKSVDDESLTSVTGSAEQMETSCNTLNYQDWWDDGVFWRAHNKHLENYAKSELKSKSKSYNNYSCVSNT